MKAHERICTAVTRGKGIRALAAGQHPKNSDASKSQQLLHAEFLLANIPEMVMDACMPFSLSTPN
jgi:hypothetical protein